MSKRPGRPPDTERNEAIAQMVAQGAPLKEIGQIFGMSKQRVSQIAHQAGVRSVWPRPKQDDHHLYDELLERMRSAKPCIVCGAWVLRNPRRYKTCSPECSDLWRLARYKLDETAYEAQRKRSARWVVAHPARHTPAQVAGALATLRGKPANRTYVIPGSQADQARQRIAELRQEDTAHG